MRFFQSSPVYHQVDLEEDIHHDSIKQQPKIMVKLRVIVVSMLIIVSCFAAGWTAGVFIEIPKAQSRCQNPRIRREWRSLSTSEKAAYIQAVRCLLLQPSITRPSGVLYDDYPYTHARVGGYCKSSNQ